MSNLLLKSEMDKLTEQIIGCAYTVSNTLGAGFVEKVYENAFVHQLRKTGMHVQQQYPIKVKYDGIMVGDFFADLLVGEQVLIELKATKLLDEGHSAQALNYLRATGLSVCLLINFGRPRIEVRHLVPSPTWKSQTP